MARRKIRFTDDDGTEFEFTPEQYDKTIINEEIGEAMQIEHFDEYDDDGNIVEEKNNWKHVAIDFSKISSKKVAEVENIPFCSVNDFMLMDNGFDGYFNAYEELSFFAYRYHKLNGFHPYVYRLDQFNINVFVENLFKRGNIPDNAYVKSTYQGSDEAIITSLFIGFKQDLVMYIDAADKACIYYNPSDEKDETSFFYTLLSMLKTVKRPKVAKNKIYVVHRNSHGFEKTGFTIKKRTIELEENYNEGFVEMSQKIIEGLNDKKKTNLVILSGEPGTGKTTYIRYLASHLKKNIIFISTDMVDSITDPAFIPFLMNNNDSILIIEDAEPALEKRNQGGRSSAVSNVLNLTDGLLSDCLKISIVATFNTKEGNIDEALTRKGRLLMNYKFEKLSSEKSKKLLEKLGHSEVEVKGPMTLADIYFYGTDNNTGDKFKTKRIGFGNKE